MLNLSKVAPPIVCSTCNGKGWSLEANPYNEGDVDWEECFTCNGLGRVYTPTDRWPHNAED